MRVIALVVVSLFAASPAFSQVPSAAPAAATAAPSAAAAAGTALPNGYVIGPEDVLSIVFWRDKDMSADVVVRPDGMISLPLLNDIKVAGLTPEQLRVELTRSAAKFMTDPTANVVVKEIHSRKVFITGNINKPASYPLSGDMTVLQLIALAGGLQEYADAKNITIMRDEGGHHESFKFNYKDVIKQKNVQQNILLKPGDTVIVP